MREGYTQLSRMMGMKDKIERKVAFSALYNINIAVSFLYFLSAFSIQCRMIQNGVVWHKYIVVVMSFLHAHEIVWHLCFFVSVHQIPPFPPLLRISDAI